MITVISGRISFRISTEDLVANLFLEPDHDRLVRRISTLAAGDLNYAQIDKVVGGDVGLLRDLPMAAKRKVAALMEPDLVGELERITGPVRADYVPVAFLELARRSASTVARIVGANRQAVGTGVMVSPHLMLTNHHVIASPDEGAKSSAQFKYELGVDDRAEDGTEFQFDPAAFFWTSPVDRLDATLIAIGRKVAGPATLESFGWTALSSAGDKHAKGDHVTIVEHPEGDYKQIALRDNRVLGRGESGVTLFYETDTLGGSSGSPVFNDDFALVALHHAGGPRIDSVLDTGEPVPNECNEGIRISRIVDELRKLHDTLPVGLRDLIAETLNPPASAVNAANPTTHLESADRSALTADIVTGDLHLPQLRISSGALATVGPRPTDSFALQLVDDRTTIAAAPSALERNDPPQPDYDKRGGYDPDFVGTRIAVPTIPRALLSRCAKPITARTHSATNVLLPYHHFSLVVRADRRMPLFTIVNIDGRKLRGINRKTGEVEAAEVWFADPRIPLDQQLAQPIFDAQKPRLFDRGHLVRRLDPAWGSATTAKFAADDTFHFTNCCLQISAFNQRLWLGIENYALDNARDEKKRITVITGPVFGDDDPAYRGVAVPRQFWKIVVRPHEGDLRATGFLADHGDALDAALAAGLLEEFDAPAEVAVFQKSIAEIEAKSGLTFGTLRAKDTKVPALESNTSLSTLEEVTW
ncbi:MAG: DNA/RNA non-specific endonuclease [Mycobacterium sp.]